MLKAKSVFEIPDFEDAYMLLANFRIKPERSWTCTATKGFYAIEPATAIHSKKNEEHGYVARRISCYF